MESLISHVVTPENLRSIVLVMLALFAKDFVVGVLRRVSRKLLGDKDPRNDVVGELAAQAADSIERLPSPGGKKR